MRHGLPLGGKTLRGKTDDEISAQGLLDMQHSVQNLAVDMVISSPLKRCHTFAKQFSKQNNLACITDDRLAEIDFGDWDGKALSELFDEPNSITEKYLADPWHILIPNGETLEKFSERIKLAINDMLDKYQGKSILVVTHAGVIRQTIANVLNIQKPNASCQQNVKIDYAAIVKFCAYTDKTNNHFINLAL